MDKEFGVTMTHHENYEGRHYQCNVTAVRPVLLNKQNIYALKSDVIVKLSPKDR